VNPLLDLAARPVIAHRGASAEAPENTLAAFELAVRQGADAIELDVRLTADGVPVVIHDATLDRTTDRRGPVAALPLAELRRTDAGARFTADGGRRFPFRGAGVGVPALAEVLRAVPETPLLVEVKEPAAQEAVRRVLVEGGAVARCAVASEHAAALVAFPDPPFARAAAGPEIAALYRASLLGRAPPAVGYRLLSVPERWRGLPVPTRRFVAAARALGCPVHVWTVDAPAAAHRLWANGVAGIVTNAPRVIREARASRR
jgi:glycerophosphoryl diester phosphodiesterase